MSDQDRTISSAELAPLLVSRAEAARALGLCERSIDALVKRGELPRIRHGRRVLFDVDDLRQWIKLQKPAA